MAFKRSESSRCYEKPLLNDSASRCIELGSAFNENSLQVTKLHTLIKTLLQAHPYLHSHSLLWLSRRSLAHPFYCQTSAPHSNNRRQGAASLVSPLRAALHASRDGSALALSIWGDSEVHFLLLSAARTNWFAFFAGFGRIRTLLRLAWVEIGAIRLCLLHLYMCFVVGLGCLFLLVALVELAGAHCEKHLVGRL